jgi:hypothetical protein
LRITANPIAISFKYLYICQIFKDRAAFFYNAEVINVESYKFMLIFLGILLSLFALVVVGTVISNKFRKKETPSENTEEIVTIPSDCCGAHEVCDFEEMIKNPEEIIYFDDEELDRYKNVSENNYNDEQIDEFREILYTLQKHEIRKWVLSIQRRSINLPSILKQEAVFMMAEN